MTSRRSACFACSAPGTLLAGGLAVAALTAAAPEGPAIAAATPEDACAELFVPEGYELSCLVEPSDDQGPWRATVQPDDGTFAGLSHLTVSPVEDPVHDPAEWLQEQLKIDVTGLDHALTSFIEDEDNPFVGNDWWDSLRGLKDVVHGFADLPLEACGEPEEGKEGDWQLVCDWSFASLHQYLTVRLVEREGAYYSVRIQAMNPRRYRHLTAIANSF
jgi:hypothetical protein